MSLSGPSSVASCSIARAADGQYVHQSPVNISARTTLVTEEVVEEGEVVDVAVCVVVVEEIVFVDAVDVVFDVEDVGFSPPQA
jgi:hypothetical protein